MTDRRKTKILHICLGSFYIDNYSYQENLLPKYHREMGCEVEILTNRVSFDENGKRCLLEKGGHYLNEYGIPVTRLEFVDHFWGAKLKCTVGCLAVIEKSAPDILFIHGCQFFDLRYVVGYIRRHPEVRVFVDNHGDFSNSARTWFSKNILHKIVWRYFARMIEPYTEKFYGVLPARVDFLVNMYGLNPDKIELLVMGADDARVREARQPAVKAAIRQKYNIAADDFLIMSGGKLDHAKKQTLLLMQAIHAIPDRKIKLIVFGSILGELKDEVFSLCDGDRVQHIGWVEAQESYDYFGAADLAVFPGRHSVFWEQVVGLGIPMLVKYWEGTDHVDLGGNCRFLYKDTEEEIRESILAIRRHPADYAEMLEVAREKGMEAFAYSSIARRSIRS